MGKKRIIKQKGQRVDSGLRNRSLSRLSRKKITSGILHITATLNNTLVTLTDKEGNSIIAASSGGLGFKGAKKGTPFAAAKVGELIGEKASIMGLKDVEVIVKGAGSGRDSAIRAFSGFGIDLGRIQDKTPVPHNGVRAPKARRV